MSEENKEGTEVPKIDNQKQADDSANKDINTPAPQGNEDPNAISTTELEELNREIEAANKKLVSDEMSKTIAAEREAAKLEAQKEFMVNQKIKDLEAEKEKIQKEKEDAERKSAEQLNVLKTKVDSLISTKAVVSTENPFRNEPVESQKVSVDRLTDEQVDDIERNSFEAFLEHKSKTYK